MSYNIVSTSGDIIAPTEHTDRGTFSMPLYRQASTEVESWQRGSVTSGRSTSMPESKLKWLAVVHSPY